MPLFKKKPKKKYGSKSNISLFRSPYRKKIITPRKKLLKSKKRAKTLVQSTTRRRQIPKTSKGKILLTIILSSCILAYGLYSVFISDNFLVEEFIIVEEGTIIDNYEKMNTILQKMIGKNIVLINDEEIVEIIKKEHPEIENVTIKKVFPRSIKIEYEKFPVTANLINTVEGIQKKFIIDSQGFLVEENTEHPDLPRIYLETNVFLEVRNSFLTSKKRSQERLTQIMTAINLFEEKFAIKINYADYKKDEREIHLHTEKHFYVMIDLERDINRQIEKLKKALPKIDIYNIPLVYIDLRISGTDTEKVIFKKR